MTYPDTECNRQINEIINRNPDRYCIYCGRELIEVTEPDILCDPETGERPQVVWKECPRYARSWRNLWMGARHTSFQRDNPIYAREYR